MTQAILGGNVKIETLNGKVEIRLKPGTAPGETITIENMGVNKLPPN